MRGGDNQPAQKSLIETLQDFNHNLMIEKTGSEDYIITRRGKGWKRALAILSADARGGWSGFKAGQACGWVGGPSGAVAGGVIGGIGVGAISSGVSAWMCSRSAPAPDHLLGNHNLLLKNMGELIETNIIYDPMVVYLAYRDIDATQLVRIKTDCKVDLFPTTRNGDISIYEEVAIGHNALLENLSNIDISILDKDYIDIILEDAPLKDQQAISMLESNEFRTEWENFIDDCLLNIDDPYHIPDNLDNELERAIWELFISINNYTEDEVDTDFVVSEYVKIISESNELTEDQKLALQSGFATLAYSLRFWEILE